MALRPGETPKQYMRRMSRPPRPWWRRALSRVRDMFDVMESLWYLVTFLVLVIGALAALYYWVTG